MEKQKCGSFPAILGGIMIFGSRATISSLKSGFYYMPIEGGNNYFYEFLDQFFNGIKSKQDEYLALVKTTTDDEKVFIKEHIEQKQFLFELLESNCILSEKLKKLGKLQLDIIQILNGRIGMFDFVDSCYCVGSGDGDTIEGSEDYDDLALLAAIKQSRYLLFNGGYSHKSKSTLNYFYDFLSRNKEIKHIIYDKKNQYTTRAKGKIIFPNGKEVEYYALASSSGAPQKYSKDERCGNWHELLSKILK